MGVSKNSGTPKSSILMNFHYKPSILGYPYFWKHSYVITQNQKLSLSPSDMVKKYSFIYLIEKEHNATGQKKNTSTSCQRNIVEPKDGSLVFSLPFGWVNFGGYWVIAPSCGTRERTCYG